MSGSGDPTKGKQRIGPLGMTQLVTPATRATAQLPQRALTQSQELMPLFEHLQSLDKDEFIATMAALPGLVANELARRSPPAPSPPPADSNPQGQPHDSEQQRRTFDSFLAAHRNILPHDAPSVIPPSVALPSSSSSSSSRHPLTPRPTSSHTGLAIMNVLNTDSRSDMDSVIATSSLNPPVDMPQGQQQHNKHRRKPKKKKQQKPAVFALSGAAQAVAGPSAPPNAPQILPPLHFISNVDRGAGRYRHPLPARPPDPELRQEAPPDLEQPTPLEPAQRQQLGARPSSQYTDYYGPSQYHPEQHPYRPSSPRHGYYEPPTPRRDDYPPNSNPSSRRSRWDRMPGSSRAPSPPRPAQWSARHSRPPQQHELDPEPWPYDPQPQWHRPMPPSLQYDFQPPPRREQQQPHEQQQQQDPYRSSQQQQQQQQQQQDSRSFDEGGQRAPSPSHSEGSSMSFSSAESEGVENSPASSRDTSWRDSPSGWSTGSTSGAAGAGGW